MQRLAWVFVFALVGAVPAAGWQQLQLKPVAQPTLPGRPPRDLIGERPTVPTAYTAPKADGPVVELLDEGVETIFPVLINDGGGEPGTIAREDRDVFAGVESVRVTPMQKYRSVIPGWNFKIVEKPEKPGEFRYLRFAWRKFGGSGMMVQFHDPAKSWGIRYHADQNVMGWQPSLPASPKLPGQWELITRDLFKDYGAFTITGFALTPYDGGGGRFDHMLLGRTIEDLDKFTAAALGKEKPEKPVAGKERDQLWADVIGTDARKAAAALRVFLATAPEQVKFLRDRLADDSELPEVKDVAKLVGDLDADDFDTRQRATEGLVKIGPAALEAVREAERNAPNDEVRFRCRTILRKLGGGAGSGPPSKASRLSRAVRVLERAASPEARSVLREIADGKLAPDLSPDAKAALARLPKLP
jgi:hypothetical protein